LQDINKPIGSFIFLGSTGVGKTELAKALAEFLFDDESAMVRIDMSEYLDKFSVTRLIGAPPGYVGYEEGGQLTEAIRRRPYSVILLDEIEKAHPDVFNILLQLLDDGRLTDSKGRTVNFSNTIIIMTSNIGSHLLQDLGVASIDLDGNEINEKFNAAKIQIINLLKKQLKPEFLNRIDEIVMFKPLSNKDISQITELQLRKLIEKLTKNGIEFTADPNAIEWLSILGFDPNYGARPLKRTIQKYVTDVLARKILSGEFSNGDKVKLSANETGDFIFNKV
jgi:ATP-dependent Clp protease ATP-binding subunit ClpB